MSGKKLEISGEAQNNFAYSEDRMNQYQDRTCLMTRTKWPGFFPQQGNLQYDLSLVMCFASLQSARETFYYYPKHLDPDRGVFAVRYKQYKAHFWTEGNVLNCTNIS